MKYDLTSEKKNQEILNSCLYYSSNIVGPTKNWWLNRFGVTKIKRVRQDAERRNKNFYSLAFGVFDSFCKIFWMETPSLSFTACMRSWSLPIPLVRYGDTNGTYPQVNMGTTTYACVVSWVRRLLGSQNPSRRTNPIVSRKPHKHRFVQIERKNSNTLLTILVPIRVISKLFSLRNPP